MSLVSIRSLVRQDAPCDSLLLFMQRLALAWSGVWSEFYQEKAKTNLLRGVSHHFNASRTKMMKFMSKNKLLFMNYYEVTYNTVFTE